MRIFGITTYVNEYGNMECFLYELMERWWKLMHDTEYSTNFIQYYIARKNPTYIIDSLTIRDITQYINVQPEHFNDML